MSRAVGRLLVAALVAGAAAKPWHTINDVDINGKTCPPLVSPSVACPLICVSNVDSCPTAVRPAACPQGNTYCPDGQCYKSVTTGNGATADFAASCATARPACVCHGGRYDDLIARPSANLLLPCRADLRADVVSDYSNGKRSRKQSFVSACASASYGNAANSSLALALAAPKNAADPFFMQCVPTVAPLDVSSSEFLAFYCVVIIQSVILLLYHSYRSLHVRPTAYSGDSNKQTTMFEEAATGSASVELRDASTRSTRSSDLHFSGYRRDTFGTITLISICLTTGFWILLMSIVIADYYEVFAGLGIRDSDLLLGSHENLSRVFIALWHIMTVWFVVLQVNSSWLTTYFFARAPLTSATHILVQKDIAAAVSIVSPGPIVDFVRSTEVAFRRMTKSDRALKLTRIKHTASGRRYIEFECVRYVLDPSTGSFEPFHFPIGPKNNDLIAQTTGLSSSEAERRYELNGPNQIVFRIDTFASGIIKEFTGIFYIYQLMMLLIWYYYAYYYMGLVITAVIVVSGIVKVVVGTNAQRRALEMATFHGQSRVLRDGTWSWADTIELVPGDLIEIMPSSHQQLSVDCVLVRGDVVVDESSLTGEALPVAKFAVKSDDVVYVREEAGKINSLYAGCHVLETRPEILNEPILAIVLSTGASTAKGRLVRDILYPMPVSFVFLEHLKIVLPGLGIWGIIMFILSIWILGSADSDAWFYGMFTISQILSPLLPAVLVIGQSISADRLRAKGIICVDLSRITLAGKVKIFCFDKTGTLTKEGLDFLGTQSVVTDNGVSTIGALDTNFTSFTPTLKHAMHCCHSLSLVNGQYVGNFVDVEMFRATGAQLTGAMGGSNNTPTVVPASNANVGDIRILKRFEFVHARAYMSVIAQEMSTGRIFAFIKGSYERVRELVDPSSLPSNFDTVARQRSANGCYVLAIACREFPAETPVADVLNMTRDQIETNAVMVGLVLFRNELKADTETALKELRSGGCRIVMITGDHISTGVHIARSCGMISRDWQGLEPQVFLGDVDKLQNVVWTDAETGEGVPVQQIESLIGRSRSGYRAVELAVTGKAFNVLRESGWMREYLLETRVFARMSPEDKVRCVRMHMSRGITAMCGDGGNDAGALKASHAGVALSEAQSSVVSHFSSRNRSILSCVDLLREARCSLDVSFASYKYLIMYGEILAFVGLVQYYFVVNLNQAMWILIDGSTVPVSWALTMAQPAARLAATRPTARLLGPETIISIVGQIVINVVFIVISVLVLYQQPFFLCREFDYRGADLRRWWELADNYEAEVTGIVSTFQILHAAATFNLGSRYRLGFMSNRAFILIYMAVFALITAVLVMDPNALGCLFHVNCGTPNALKAAGYAVPFNALTDNIAPGGHNVMPMWFRWVVWGISVLNLVAVLLWEGVVVLGPGRALALRYWPPARETMRV